MERVSTIILLVGNIKENGFMIRNMDMEPYSMLMEINIKDIGRMDKDPDKEFTSIQMGIFTKDNGLQT